MCTHTYHSGSLSGFRKNNKDLYVCLLLLLFIQISVPIHVVAVAKSSSKKQKQSAFQIITIASFHASSLKCPSQVWVSCTFVHIDLQNDLEAHWWKSIILFLCTDAYTTVVMDITPSISTEYTGEKTEYDKRQHQHNPNWKEKQRRKQNPATPIMKNTNISIFSLTSSRLSALSCPSLNSILHSPSPPHATPRQVTLDNAQSRIIHPTQAEPHTHAPIIALLNRSYFPRLIPNHITSYYLRLPTNKSHGMPVPVLPDSMMMCDEMWLGYTESDPPPAWLSRGG